MPVEAAPSSLCLVDDVHRSGSRPRRRARAILSAIACRLFARDYRGTPRARPAAPHRAPPPSPIPEPAPITATTLPSSLNMSAHRALSACPLRHAESTRARPVASTPATRRHAGRGRHQTAHAGFDQTARRSPRQLVTASTRDRRPQSTPAPPRCRRARIEPADHRHEQAHAEQRVEDRSARRSTLGNRTASSTPRAPPTTAASRATRSTVRSLGLPD